MARTTTTAERGHPVYVDVSIALDRGLNLAASQTAPRGESRGIVVFAHGSGSSRHSPRNRQVAYSSSTPQGGARCFSTYSPRMRKRWTCSTGEHRFDVQMLGNRVVAAIDWLHQVDDSPIGLFGASTGAAAALIAAAARPRDVFAVVSRGGRPDLAGDGLPSVRAPTLLIVGSRDTTVLALNESARAQMEVEVPSRSYPARPISSRSRELSMWYPDWRSIGSSVSYLRNGFGPGRAGRRL